MKTITNYLIVLFLISSFNSHAQKTANGYRNYNLSGFNVLVQEQALIKNGSQTQVAIKLLEGKLIEVCKLNINPSILNSLKDISIFMDWATGTEGIPTACYHSNPTWLSENNKIPEKIRSIDISNINNFIDWQIRVQPYMVLHELAHAYHEREFKYDNQIITKAFNHAQSNNLYRNVLKNVDGTKYEYQDTAYALVNHMEYFAEITEAYFGLNDYFPFTKNDLKLYDPIGYAAVRKIWQGK